MSIQNTKRDTGKPPVGDLVRDHSNAIELLAYIVSFSKIKYGIPTGFLYFPDAENKIYNSITRHMTRPFSLDAETGQPHISLALTELLMYREYEFKQEQGNAYIDEAEQLYGVDLYKRMNDEAIKEKSPEVWYSKWQEKKQELIQNPQLIPVAETMLRTPQAIDKVALAYNEYKQNGLSLALPEKFAIAGSILEKDRTIKAFEDQKADSYDVAGSLLLSIMQERYSDPKSFLIP